MFQKIYSTMALTLLLLSLSTMFILQPKIFSWGNCYQSDTVLCRACSILRCYSYLRLNHSSHACFPTLWKFRVMIFKTPVYLRHTTLEITWDFLQSEMWLLLLSPLTPHSDLHLSLSMVPKDSFHNMGMDGTVSASSLTARINVVTTTAMPGDKLQATTEVDRHTTNVTVCSRRDKALTVVAERLLSNKWR